MSFQIGSIPMMWMSKLIWEREVIKELTDANETTKLREETYLTFKNITQNVSMYLVIFLEVQSRGSHFFESRYGLKLASYMQHWRARPLLLLSESLQAKEEEWFDPSAHLMRLWATLLSNPIHKWGRSQSRNSLHCALPFPAGLASWIYNEVDDIFCNP